MVTIHLHGPQAGLLKEPLRVVAATVEEALSALRQIKGFKPIPGKHAMVYQILGRERMNDLMKPLQADEEIHLVPAMCGGGGKGSAIGSILLGAALIAVAWWNPIFLGLGATTIGLMLTVGASLALGGLMALMSTPPADLNSVQYGDAGGDPMASKYLGSSKNTTKIGTRIPIAFGRNKIPGHILSFNISSSFGVGTPYLSTVIEPGTTPPATGAANMNPTAVYP